MPKIGLHRMSFASEASPSPAHKQPKYNAFIFIAQFLFIVIDYNIFNKISTNPPLQFVNKTLHFDFLAKKPRTNSPRLLHLSIRLYQGMFHLHYTDMYRYPVLPMVYYQFYISFFPANIAAPLRLKLRLQSSLPCSNPLWN